MFFQKFIDPLLNPFRKIRTKWINVKTAKGRVQGDVRRAKNVGKEAKGYAGKAKDGANKVSGQANDAKGKAGAMKGKVGAAGAQAGAVGGNGAALNPKPGVKKVGFFRKKLICEQCGQQLDKTWDECPYCAQAAAAAPPGASQKTMAFMIDSGGSATGQRMLAWLVPIEGPSRGELFTLAPNSIIGTDPDCTVVLADQFMSSHHAEIKAENGAWILKDLGSTNGTYVNDQRIDSQELVDNDFVKFGGSQVKFKSL